MPPLGDLDSKTNEPAEPGLFATYVRVLLVEAVIIFLLVLLGRAFS